MAGENERFGRAEALDVRFDFVRVRGDVDIGEHLLSRQNRIEFLGVEIEIVDVVACPAQRLDDARVEGRHEARLKRMGIDNKNAHEA